MAQRAIGMRIKPPTLPPDTARLYVSGAPRAFFVDVKYIRKLRKVRWRWIEKKQRARGYFGRDKIRLYLHRYVLALARKYYAEVTFANGDYWDCRLVNLKPYRREEDGAQRRLFKNNTSRRKGVSWHKRRKKWAAMIRSRGKLRHLGYYKTADAAADAYQAAYALAHPTLGHVQSAGRFK